jgi:hypothetical protein
MRRYLPMHVPSWQSLIFTTKKNTLHDELALFFFFFYHNPLHKSIILVVFDTEIKSYFLWFNYKYYFYIKTLFKKKSLRLQTVTSSTNKQWLHGYPSKFTFVYVYEPTKSSTLHLQRPMSIYKQARHGLSKETITKLHLWPSRTSLMKSP